MVCRNFLLESKQQKKCKYKKNMEKSKKKMKKINKMGKKQIKKKKIFKLLDCQTIKHNNPTNQRERERNENRKFDRK